MTKNISNTLLIFILLAVFFVSLPPLSFAGVDEEGVNSFRRSVTKLLSNSCLRKNKYGVKIYSLDRGETLYEIRSNRLFIPASNAKILTTAVALKYLGSNYRYTTRIYTDGVLENQILKGNLYIKGSGDPKLVTEQLWLLVNELRNLPIKKITGNIIADSSFFDERMRVKTWIKNPGAQAYEAPLGALSFNFNTIKVYVSPGKKTGDRPEIVIEPENDYIKLENKARTLKPGRRNRLIVNRVDKEGHDLITVSGGINLGQPRAQYFLNITNPTQYALNVFKSYLGLSEIKFDGQLQEGTLPENAVELHAHEGEPLALALRGLNKFSNNFVAEQILKTIGAEHLGQPGSTQKGLSVFEEYMKQLGYEPNQYKIFDGSGLSRQNRLSPTIIVDILRNVKDDLNVYPEFVSALGVMGVDGNVKNRMKKVESSGKARVKTGTLNFVSTLSGFFESKEGELFAFSILMNDLKCSNRRVKKIQDQIIQKGLNFRRVPTGSVLTDDRTKRLQTEATSP
ncbi:MAG: D-alanyl-D-alanine carboxypeptidase/D-alanyl-D-alanine-endopeptidase [Nitrospina sp.]|jgi:serine-type D-Ala-D-Ala carboxypeptidase/endopeptidase (penicillin-binding protein 4)|nr:D-alanyl-D-alanine carboxypeptidase/D-alanyl-D-alanine-endopeptidase [Nitrospina sp.]MBT6717042.1 D-alanyl-D-alanine carboxypeptidase/D-alanyl-D-alanine-endopeptidase [Nitrospina sp.]